MPTRGFLPSVNGLPFINSWPASSFVARRGLCGGMVFAALDLFALGQLPPDAAPVGSPLYHHIVRRLFASWDIPGGVVRYAAWMALSDGSVADRTASGWPAIRSLLDGGHPVPLGLVAVRSANPFRLGQNHQVLAYGYDRETVRVYDPNTSLARADDVRIRLDLSGHNVNIAGPVRGFFRVGYTPADPPGSRA